VVLFRKPFNFIFYAAIPADSMDLFSFQTLTPSLPILFLLSFLAATILPIGSEWLLILMIVKGFAAPSVVATASIGNYLGACTTYLLGVWGSDFCQRKLLRIDRKDLEKADTYYRKYGILSLLLSWLPIIGDPLCFLAGTFRVHFVPFSILVFLGKFGRYATLAFLTLQGTGG
jgi:membrane protein YqaA with SNARE-associated domain